MMQGWRGSPVLEVLAVAMVTHGVTLPSGEQQRQIGRVLRRWLPTKGSTCEREDSTRDRGKVRERGGDGGRWRRYREQRRKEEIKGVRERHGRKTNHLGRGGGVRGNVQKKQNKKKKLRMENNRLV